ncbi:hypothetical protein LOK49_LG06G01355 [Camellia lanceoleosa]|uniref:Uncharacterized protein n=1 Tax=Camellia lanceoleosa TaxID=1840588 RepID=A0ACC0HFS8_9ERIC|nr:hypothetical protein LOK49_LG06G01355 [Camellia lanceoleosa]
MPTAVLLRWGSWSYTLPIWVEVWPTVAPVAPIGGEEVGLDFGLAGQDLRRKNRGFAKFVGFHEYLQRFQPPTDLSVKQVRVSPSIQVHSEVGSLGDSSFQHLGYFEAQTNVGVSLGQQRWVPRQNNPQVGLDGDKVISKVQGTDLGLLVKDPILPNQGDFNPPFTRVWASLRDSLELPRPLSAVELTPESGQARSMVVVPDVGGSPLLPASSGDLSPNLPDLSQLSASRPNALELRRTVTDIVVSPECGRSPVTAAVEVFGGFSHLPKPSVEVALKQSPLLVTDEHCLQELCCEAGCETDGTAIEVVDDVEVEEGIHSPAVDFHEDIIPSSEEVSQWVLSRITEGECPELPSGNAFEA